MFIVLQDVFFFFKQKTAYEMRISDWSSDVCSSDLSIAGVSWSASSTARKLSPGTVKMRSHPCATRLSTRMRPPVRVFTRLLPVAFHNVIRAHAGTRRARLPRRGGHEIGRAHV